ncbi:uncharacterized protein LOC122251829 [Penaeus japonicus]|uniref:uncharacterized protein LOC122251829 n=1 Tax=Penaeus japonicus TaxID=27405 RepID=UPI001C71349D|nr:uncharacterized protein LOC122251829 [Penaeus japonicus]
MMRVCCLGRRTGGRRALVGLITGAALSLLVLALTPHPAPFSRRAPPHVLRRIHQEDDDYTAPKPLAAGPSAVGGPTRGDPSPEETPRGGPGEDPAAATGAFNLPVLAHPGAGGDAQDTGVGHVQEVVRPGEQSRRVPEVSVTGAQDPVARFAQDAMDVPRTKEKAGEHVMKAQETALTALQHGYKLTAGQKKLIDRMSPKEKKEMEQRVTKLRAMQEKAYIEQLRTKNQVVARPGGGEELVSTPQKTVRFPISLKKTMPTAWLPQYKIFQNLTHYPWSIHRACANYSNSFRPPNSLPTRALASFPSSGNTWIRYLIEGATGIFTGSLYDDSSLIRKGMYGEGIIYNSGMTILQKSHGYTTGDAMKLPHEERLNQNHMEELSHQGVLIIRNPFKALISHRHLDVGGHTGYAPKAHFVGKGWAEFVSLKIQLWRDFYVDWLSTSKPENIHIIHYEHLKKNPVEEMRKVIQYLKLPENNDRLDCLGQHTDGLFKRKPSKNVPLDLNPFTRELKDLIYAAIDDLNNVLRETGKDQLPLEIYELYDGHEAEVARYLRAHAKDS